MRIPLVLLGALLLSGLPAFTQTFTFEVTYGPGSYWDSADLIVQTVLEQPATPESPSNVWYVTSIAGTWTSGEGPNAGQTFQVTPPFGTDIFGVIGPNNSVLGGNYYIGFNAGPYEIFLDSTGHQPEGEHVFTNTGQYSPDYPDGFGGGYDVQGKLIATAPFEPSDAVFLVGGATFVAMMWRKRRTQSVRHALN